ncbi:MAG: peptidoglycan DD-metalloendopeptidase family protein [bacterium]
MPVIAPATGSTSIVPVRLTAFIAAAALCASLFSSPISSSQDDLSGKQDELQKKINQTRKILNRKNLEEKDILKQINRVDVEIGKAEDALERTNRELIRTRTEHAFLSRKLVETTEAYEKQLSLYHDRLVAIYKHGSVGYLEVILNSTSFGDLMSRTHYIRLIAMNDQDAISRIQALRRDVEDKKRQVESKQGEIEKVKTAHARRKQYALALKNDKKTSLKKIQNDISLYEKQLREMEEENKRIEEEIRRRQRGKPGVTYTGRLGSPLCGRRMVITSGFGHRTAPKRGASEYHRGLDMRASMGSTICAADDGVVFSAQRRSGYGLTVMIEHAGNLITLYAHGQKFLVSEGQKVKRGDPIMLADSTGVSTGSHLHFEVRVNGAAVNPMNYF